ncbi:hypothetical protein BV25DRAFT_1846818 [Artomyces pyxidatus]|uniref:Uncharacterized protein n=1 Tax=Artomyces pyxidatus TaxID=48021 RepID=A0ACB8TGU7_9AGAM|nr:hypothetical protein BV25DRAFT_1846818 [Artomyces pyxidatus]
MATNAQPSARIRRYIPDDEKQVRFMVGQAQMENLAYANNRAYFHPLTLAIWIAVSSVFAQILGSWPDPSHGFLGYLQVLPAFFTPMVPIMFFIDWKNRPTIEERAERVLREVDLLDMGAYYARSPASGFYILEYGDKIIGLIALDASKDSTNEIPVTGKLSDAQREQLLHGKGTSAVATIRHFFAEEAFRRTGIEEDLLEYAVRKAFEVGKEIKTIRAVASPLRPTVRDALRKAGFVEGDNIIKVGVMKEPLSWWMLQKSRWEASLVKKSS